MTSNPKITVVIPTRERCETLAATIRTCVDQDYDNFDIVVADNVSQDATEEVVRSFNDPRLRHVRPDRRLSMTSNFEFALSQAKPGFVVSVGDDDGLMPGSVRIVADIVARTGVKAVTSRSVYYCWPNLPVEGWRDRMCIFRPVSRPEIRDAKAALARVASFRGGATDYVWALPGVYRGFVSTEVIESAKRDGRYLNSITPDAYSAFVNAGSMDRFMYYDKPLTIEGVSGRSNGASQALGHDKGEESRFLQEADIPFHADLVYSPSHSVIMAEAYMQMRDRFPEICKDHDFDLTRVCEIAMRRAQGANRDREIKCAQEILAKHGLSPRSRDPRELVEEVWQRTRNAWRTTELDCKAHGVTDVHQAARLAHTVVALQDHPPQSGIGFLARKVVRKLGLS